jgi:2-dehydropantoate 2-reductase
VRLKKGQAQVRKRRGIGIAGSHQLVNELLLDLERSGLSPRHYQDEKAMKWSKLITNLLGNASSAILDLSPAEIYAHKDLYQVEISQIKEALRVMQLMDISAVNLPGIPVKVLAGVVKFLPGPVSQPLLSRLIGSGRGEKMPSFHIDLYSGRGESEVDQLNGAVVRAGKQVNCPTPVNNFLTMTLTSLLAGDLPLDRYQGKPELFLKDLKRFQQRSHISE